MAFSPNNNLKIDDLCVGQLNVQSIKSNKLQVINYLERHNVHVLLLSETWLSLEDDFVLENYKLHDQRRNDGYGGAGILLKNYQITNYIS